MATSRAELLKELLPGLNQLFGMEYNATPYDIQAKIDQIMLDDLKKAEELQNGDKKSRLTARDVEWGYSIKIKLNVFAILEAEEKLQEIRDAIQEQS